MSTPQFLWKVLMMYCSPYEDGKQDVVVTVNWQCIGMIDNNGEQASAAIGDGTNFIYEQGQSFTPYDQLTQEQVLGWVWQKVDKEQIQNDVLKKIADQFKPPVITPPLPWSN